MAASDVYPPVQEEVARLAAAPEVRAAFERFRAQESKFALWQIEATRVAAPPFGEEARGAWLADRFRDLGLIDVHVDEVGNVFGVRPGCGSRFVSLSAHIDTVFPAATPLNIRQEGSRLYGPGVSDNGAVIAAMLAVASVLATSRISHASPFVFIGNVGEEGEGDLRGMRQVFATPRWRDGIAYSVIVDGAGSDTVVAEALGSRRFEIIVGFALQLLQRQLGWQAQHHMIFHGKIRFRRNVAGQRGRRCRWRFDRRRLRSRLLPLGTGR